jgi:hypothetical protein
MSVRQSEQVAPGARLDRRGFVRRAGLAALGAAGAAPVVGSASALAAGSSPAYTDVSNTFTGLQRVDANVGIGTVPNHPLDVVRTEPGSAVSVQAHTMALELTHDVDWAGETHDLVNLYHRSTGDGIFIAHQGGKPPGFTGVTGGNAALNVLIPYTLDDTGAGRGGSVVNNRTGMQGLHVETQAVSASRAIDVQHFSNGYAMYMGVQLPNAGQPTGKGGAIYIDDSSSPSTLYMRVAPPGGGARDSAAIRIDDDSSVSGIRVDKRTAPATSSDAIVNLVGRTTDPMLAITVRDGGFGQRFRVDSDGQIAIYDGAGTLRANVTPAGRSSFGSALQFGGVQMQVTTDGNGVKSAMALINRDPGAGSGTTLEFDDAGAQFATIKATYEARSVGSRASSLSFQVRSSDNLAERIRIDGTGLGFFGARPVAKPVVTGSRAGVPALASLLAALSKVGLVTDSTTA